MADWPVTVTIAEGTPYEIAVLDLRGSFTWSKYAAFPRQGQPRLIVYHHTATVETTYYDFRGLEQRLMLLASVSPYGLPYNFVVALAPLPVVVYLNDIDAAWPHTLGHNDAVAICALGNFDIEQPHAELVPTMGLLADALATMWGRFVPEVAHRQVSATACPGSNLYALLALARELEPPE